jgi:protein-tyrosine phosphatase
VPGFVDVHSHVIPSGDDGVASIEEGLALCAEAARRGTRILYGTPHVWPFEGLSPDREVAVRAAYAEMRPMAAQAELELRLGFELTPAPALLNEELGRYALERLEPPSLLVEFPFTEGLELTYALAEYAESEGFRPILAHPERAEAVLERRSRVDAFAERGWPLQVNATSLLGRHGPDSARVGWWLVERGLASLVGSDGHRAARPPFLDQAYAAARVQLGSRADRFFDGSALGLVSSESAVDVRATQA